MKLNVLLPDTGNASQPLGYPRIMDTSNNTVQERLIIFSVVFVAIWFASYILTRAFGNKAPVFGVQTRWEPFVFSSFRFLFYAEEILLDGYNNCKGKVFQLRRADKEILVLPPKFVDEIRKLPNRVASPIVAHAKNLIGPSTNMNIILQSNLHTRALQLKLTPNINTLIPHMQDEVDFAIEHQLPSLEDGWVVVKPYYALLDIVARVSAKSFLGNRLCRNTEWLDVSKSFTENAFGAIILLRLLPHWTHWLMSWFIPFSWKGAALLKTAKRLLVPEIQHRLDMEKEGIELEDDIRNTHLSWMIEIATEEEKNPAFLAHLQVVMALASIHTSKMNVINVLYDLLAYPEYLEPLRKEIRELATEKPWKTWGRLEFAKLRKLDSFMRESQRVNPPTLLSMHRVVSEKTQFSDGTVIPKGAHISVAVNAIQNDPEVTTDPGKFDGFRYYKLRERVGESNLHQFATTENRVLNFGHGPNACPGRFFASIEIKIILVRLLMDFDFQLKVGEKRPKNMYAHEFVFPDPRTEILVRRRPASDRLRV